MAIPHSPKQLRAKRTRRELLGAARLVFAQGGYDGATVEDIAKAAGCSKGAYYFHFASKEETLLALLDAWITDRTERLKTAAGAPPEAVLAGVARALCGQESGWPADLLMEFWSQAQRNEHVGARLAQAYSSWQATLASAIERAVPQDPTLGAPAKEAAAGTMLALADGFLLQSSVRVATMRPATAEQVLAALPMLVRLGVRGKVA